MQDTPMLWHHSIQKIISFPAFKSKHLIWTFLVWQMLCPTYSSLVALEEIRKTGNGKTGRDKDNGEKHLHAAASDHLTIACAHLLVLT